MAGVKTFQDLLVWQKSHQFVLSIYRATQQFPKSELYGLVNQMRRAAVSVPANIAEGFKKKSKAEKGHYYTIAHSSLEESRYYLILAKDLGYCKDSEMMKQLEEASKLLTLYRRKIEGA